MTEEELYNEYRKSDCKSFTDFLINKIAELREQLGEVEMQKAGEKSDLVWKLKTANEQKAEQLTKAKELLKQWLQTSKASGCDNINIVTDTEQFLNSKVEK